jgi:hypothetical protein
VKGDGSVHIPEDKKDWRRLVENAKAARTDIETDVQQMKMEINAEQQAAVDIPRRNGKERDLEDLIDVNTASEPDDRVSEVKTTNDPYKEAVAHFNDQILYAKAKLQFPDMSEEELLEAVEGFKKLEDKAREDFFKEYEQFEEIMKKPEPRKLNRAQRRAREKARRKPVQFRSSDKPKGRPKGYQQNDVPVSHAQAKDADEAREYTLRAQRERLANMYEDMDDPNYIAPVLPAEALQALNEVNKENR